MTRERFIQKGEIRNPNGRPKGSVNAYSHEGIIARISQGDFHVFDELKQIAVYGTTEFARLKALEILARYVAKTQDRVINVIEPGAAGSHENALKALELRVVEGGK